MLDDAGADDSGRAASPPKRRIVVDPGSEGGRLDRFLAGILTELSRQQIQRRIQDGDVTVDGRPAKPSMRLAAGQTVECPPSAPPAPLRLEPEPVPLQIVYEDDDLLVVHKPPGLVVHPGAGVRSGTLVQGLLHHLPGWKGVGGADRPGIVHRLDRGTSGLMVVAKSGRAYMSLTRQIQTREVARRYVSLVWGAPARAGGLVDRPIGRDPRHRQRMAVVARGGRPAVTEFERLLVFDTLSLLRLCLRTGRTHQIRVHLSSMGHPVFGDAAYGGGKAYVARLAPRDRPGALRWLKSLGRPALHAYHLSFRHPADREVMVFEAPVPRDMEQILTELETQRKGTGGER
jgi:23S rRNA pseudouridine1911/1915/1917 synthase